MNTINGFIYSFGGENEFTINNIVYKKAAEGSPNAIKVGVIEPLKILPDNPNNIIENNIGHFEGEVFKAEKYQTEKLTNLIDYGVNLDTHIQKIKEILYLTPANESSPNSTRNQKNDYIICDKRAWEKITKKTARLDYYVFELFDDNKKYVGKEFFETWPAMLLMEANFDDVIAYMKGHNLYEEKWPYTHIWQNGLDFAQMAPIINRDKFRVFVLGYFHSYNGIYVRDEVFPNLGPNDYVLIVDWGAVYPPSSLLISKAKYPKNIFWLANGFEEWKYLTSQGVQCYIVSHNAFVNHSIFDIIKNQEKLYDAVFCQSVIPFKRPGLTKLIPNIAYLTGSAPSNQYLEMIYRNEEGKRDMIVNSSPSQVSAIMNKAFCGLSLSLAEGGNYATTEYLLSGLPVISTKNWGGRNIYLNEYNSVFCEEDTPEEVLRCVKYIKNSYWKYNPQLIRQHALRTSQEMIKTLKDEILKPIVENYGYNTSEIDALVNHALNESNPNSKGRTIFQPEFKKMRIK